MTGSARARELYQRCLELDPGFAPAWAHLGRCHRVIGKFIDAHARQRGARRGGLSTRARAQPAPVGGAQVLREPGGGHGPGAASARAPAGRGQPSRQRSGAVRRPRPRLSLLWALRTVDRRARRGAPARPERSHEPRADAADDGRHRTAPGRRAAPLFAGGDEGIRVIGLDWPGVATRRAGALLEMRQAPRDQPFRRGPTT